MRSAGIVLATLTLTLALVPQASAGLQPGLFCEEAEMTVGRLFPDPEQTTDFISWDDFVCGLTVLEERHPERIEVKVVAQSVGWANRLEMGHDRFPVYAIEVTDETVPAKRGNLVFITSIHGNEKGAREGMVRVIEDLVIGEGIVPRVEAATGLAIDDILRDVRVVFTFPNPDGWVHEAPEYRLNDACYVSVSCGAASEPGEIGVESQNFVRVNGNGTDLNRQYPTTGTLFDGKEQMTEPEIKSLVAYYDSLPEPTIAGVDLHGMLDAEALNYLLIKDTQRTLLEVAQHEALARTTAERMDEDETVSTWETTGGPAVVWGSTIDLLGYSAPGTGGAYIVQDTGLDAAGFTIEQTFSHITFDNWYPGPGQGMNILHVASMRATAAAFLEYAVTRPTDVRLDGDARVGYLAHPGVIANARYDGSDADPNAFFAQAATEGADVRRLDDLTPGALDGLTHLVVPGPALAADDPLLHTVVHPWVEAGGTLVLTDEAVAHAVTLGLADGVRDVTDFTGRMHQAYDHALLHGTNPPVRTLVDGNPLGYAAGEVPIHCLEGFVGDVAGERVAGGMAPVDALGGTGGAPCTVVGAAALGSGSVVVIASAFPSPVKDHGFGVDGYALTPNGARIVLNAMGLSLVEGEGAAAADAGQDTEDAESIPVPWVAVFVALVVAGLVVRRRG